MASSRTRPQISSTVSMKALDLAMPGSLLSRRDIDDGLDAAGTRRHHRHAVGEIDRLLHVVGDEDHGLGAAPPDASSSLCIRWRVWASSAPNGSSISRILGSMASVRAIAVRCFMPPESCEG